ncbi:hypothetical protein [Flagellimonas onchidii]|uniref:hypothetical protein n=1 Tax=Flagellimonas onchidii TaxID=2562684 RepID=UPI0010A66E8F|nr:hypothetical protein [Allomuricauda onchidii]
MKYNFLISLFVLSLLGCKSGFDVSHEKSEIDYQVINAFTSLRKINALKKDTFKPNDSLLLKLVESDGLNLFHYNLTENRKNIDFKELFSEQDFNLIKKGFEQLEIRKLDKKKMLKGVRAIKKIDDDREARMITTPVIVPDKNYAFIYSESLSDGDLFCMKKENGKWIPFVSFPLWTSD